MEVRMQNHGTKGIYSGAVNRPAPAPGAKTMFEKAQYDLEQDPVVPGAVTATHITGTAEVPWVPAQPPNSPWASDPVPPEEPLGYDINALPDMTKVDRG
jgi:hypothetical protein